MNTKSCIGFVVWLLLPFPLESQELKVNIYDQKVNEELIMILGDNDEYFPVSVQIKLELKALQTSHENGEVIVLQPRSKQQPLIQLKPIPGQSWSYRSSFQAFAGDVTLTHYDTNHLYELPFAKGTQETISQGYFGKISHQNEYALDFDMKEGTPVHAIRGGTVVKVVDIHHQSCPDISCMQFNNYIVIEHPDGTYADYAHLKKNSAQVSIGDQVETGAYLAKSGNTGWTTGPHLHLVVYIPALQKRKTIPTLFKIGKQQSTFLEERKRYQRF